MYPLAGLRVFNAKNHLSNASQPHRSTSMSLTFNSKALDAFRNIKMSDDNAIAQLDSQTGRIKQVDRYKGSFFTMFRTGGSKTSPNTFREKYAS